jgi:acetolactate synthase-1/2/3 large subunit
LKKLNGAEYVIKFLEEKEVDIIFGYPGGKVLTLYDALYKAIENKSRITHILTRHEQGAIHAAEGYARTTGKTGVVFTTSGPGATNIVTGLADAMLDSVPVFAITGQVNTSVIGRDAFQEADMIGVTLSITKHNYLIRNIKDLPYVLEEAWQIAGSGRFGPVLVDIPGNIFAEKMPDEYCEDTACRVKYIPKEYKKIYTFDEQKDKILELFLHSLRPVILAGGGVTSSKNAPELMLKFMNENNIPCAATLMGKSAVDMSDELSFGMAGMHGLPAANMAIANSDLVIAVGTRFSDRTVGNPQMFASFRAIIHADIDISEIDKNVKVDIPVITDASEFFQNLINYFEDLRNTKSEYIKIFENKMSQWKKWSEEVKKVREKEKQNEQKIFVGKLKMREVIRKVVETVESYKKNKKVSYVTDVGQHQMIAAQETRPKVTGSFITSGGLGTMGFGLPAAVGAAFGKKDGQVILFTGDGGVQMNIQELATVKKTHVPVKIFILDNKRLGMVRQWQKHFYDGNYSQSILNDNPDFIKIAEAYKIKAVKIAERKDLDKKITEIIESQETMLIHVLVDPTENVYPIIPMGKGHHEMLFAEEAKNSEIFGSTDKKI